MRISHLLFISILYSGASFANETFMCTHGDQERKIEVVYLGDESVPCEVQYTKDGSTETLWNAQGEAGYCEQKAQEFVDKQQGWGWDCSLQTASDQTASDQ